jgi:aerobic-type carbon monoxide dehydrogenase small subunit (CoxS/CutS family)
VLVDGRRVNGCLTLAVRMDGAEVTTIGDLADGDDLTPLQEAFIEQDAFQCGFCTPGQILSGTTCIRALLCHSVSESTASWRCRTRVPVGQCQAGLTHATTVDHAWITQ